MVSQKGHALFQSVHENCHCNSSTKYCLQAHVWLYSIISPDWYAQGFFGYVLNTMVCLFYNNKFSVCTIHFSYTRQNISAVQHRSTFSVRKAQFTNHSEAWIFARLQKRIFEVSSCKCTHTALISLPLARAETTPVADHCRHRHSINNKKSHYKY